MKHRKKERKYERMKERKKKKERTKVRKKETNKENNKEDIYAACPNDSTNLAVKGERHIGPMFSSSSLEMVIPDCREGGGVGVGAQTCTLWWLPCLARGVTGSVPGLVGPASVNCDWVR